MVTFKIVQCHPGLTYIYNFWQLGTLALNPERQSARMSEIYRLDLDGQVTSLPFSNMAKENVGSVALPVWIVQDLPLENLLLSGHRLS